MSDTEFTPEMSVTTPEPSLQRVERLKQLESKRRLLRKRIRDSGEQVFINYKRVLETETRVAPPPWNTRSLPATLLLADIYNRHEPYKVSDRSQKLRSRKDRKEVLEYYGCPENPDSKRMSSAWCHVDGWYAYAPAVEVAYIVPHFAADETKSRILFGLETSAPSPEPNALLLTEVIKKWFHRYLVAVVPVDPTEVPITRWQIELPVNTIANVEYVSGSSGKTLHKRELKFLNDSRPGARFLYFHFIMGLMRLRETGHAGWEDAWSRYYTHRPFPSATPYLRDSMIRALACYYRSSDLKVIDSWIRDNGFVDDLRMTPIEMSEVARRILEGEEDY